MAGGPVASRFDQFLIGCLTATAIAVSTPSIFDTLGWFNAVAIYLTGVVAAVGTAAWMMTRLAVRQPATTAWHVVTSALVGLVAAGFTELIGTLIALASLLAIANIRDLMPSGPRRRRLQAAYLALTAGATSGVLLIFLGPEAALACTCKTADFTALLSPTQFERTSGRKVQAWACELY